jgi:hypothetical protein
MHNAYESTALFRDNREAYARGEITLDPWEFERHLTATYFSKGVMGTWSIDDGENYIKRFSDGQTIVYQGALNNLPLMSANIPWRQVIQFRKDKESIRKLRDLRLWLNDSFKAGSIAQATDMIGQKIDDYKWALRKHGLKTVEGVFAHLIEWKQSATVIGATTATTLAGGDVLGALAGGLAITGSLGAFLISKVVDRREVMRGPGREIAILLDAQRRFTPH